MCLFAHPFTSFPTNSNISQCDVTCRKENEKNRTHTNISLHTRPFRRQGWFYRLNTIKSTDNSAIVLVAGDLCCLTSLLASRLGLKSRHKTKWKRSYDFEREAKWNSGHGSFAAAIWLKHFVSYRVGFHFKCPHGGTMEKLQPIDLLKQRQTGCIVELPAI